MVSKVSAAAVIGLVVAAFNLGGLSAPWVGSLADRYHWRRQFLIGGFILTTIGAASFPFAANPALWLILALLIGVGAAAASTVANLFIVERHPKDEWDQRIGWLQTFYAGGQVAGLLLAGFFSRSALQDGLWVAAGCTAVGSLWALQTTRHLGKIAIGRPPLRNPSKQGEWPVVSPQRMYHYSGVRALKRMINDLTSRFSLFQIAWFFSFTGTASIFALYPMLMANVYGIQPVLSTPVFAVAAALGLALYTPAGYYTKRSGTASVFTVGLITRLLAVIVMLIAGVTRAIPGFLALIGFMFIVMAWSLLSVSSTAWVAELSPVNEGEGMGIFNGVTALASVVGAVLGGWVAGQFGYASVPFVALVGIGGGLFLTGYVTHRARNSKSKTRLNE